ILLALQIIARVRLRLPKSCRIKSPKRAIVANHPRVFPSRPGVDAVVDQQCALEVMEEAIKITATFMSPAWVPVAIKGQNFNAVVLHQLFKLSLHVADVAVKIRLTIQLEARAAMGGRPRSLRVPQVVVLIEVQNGVVDPKHDALMAALVGDFSQPVPVEGAIHNVVVRLLR